MLPRLIEGFVALAHLEHMGLAAESLYIGQPALSARIAALERELGSPLFVRSRTGMRLTPAGRTFLPYAERALDGLRSGAALVDEMRRGSAGEVTIGAVPTVSTYVLPELLVRFTARHANVRLFVRTGHSHEIAEAVVNGELSLGLIRELRDPRVLQRPLYSDDLHLVARWDHPLATAGSIDIARLSETRLILFDRSSSYFELTRMVFATAGVAPHDVVQVDSIEAAKRMVERGLGVAMLPGTAIADGVAARTIASVRVDGTERQSRRIALVQPLATGELDGPVAAFIDTLDSMIDSIPGAVSLVAR